MPALRRTLLALLRDWTVVSGLLVRARWSVVSYAACIKRRYGSERSARKKLRELRKRRHQQHAMKVEDHAYHCDLCGAWHLTSQSREVALR